MAQLKMYHKLTNLPEATMPAGFTIRPFRNGEEGIWVDICKNKLLEETADVKAFADTILCFRQLVPERDIFFVCDETGKPVATICGFINDRGQGNVHMVAASPAVKGHGIGRAMTAFILHKLKADLEGTGQVAMLTTDDWRVSAVVSYLRVGFQPVLYDTGMPERWKALCDMLNIHDVEMLDDNGLDTGIFL